MVITLAAFIAGSVTATAHMPFWTSLLVRTFAWMVLLQQKGLINQILLQLGLIDHPLTLIYNRIGVIVGMVYILLPFMILPLYSVLTRIDSSYTSAAASLGAPPVRNFLRIYLPLSLPGVLTGTLLDTYFGPGVLPARLRELVIERAGGKAANIEIERLLCGCRRGGLSLRLRRCRLCS